MKAKDFEKNIKDSKEILEKLMNNDINLEESMKLYEEGMKNLKEANKLLQNAKLKYEEIKREED